MTQSKKIILLTTSLILTICLMAFFGVYALTTLKNSTFNVGVKYEPEYLVKVEMWIDGANGGTKDKIIDDKEYVEIFNSLNPVSNGMYIHSMSNDTIHINSQTLKPIGANGEVHFKITSLENETSGNKNLKCVIDCGSSTVDSGKIVSNETKILRISTGLDSTNGTPASSSLGMIKINLKFSEYILDFVDLKDLDSNSSTELSFGELGTIKHSDITGKTFYVSDIDGLLKLSALVGQVNTTTTGYDSKYDSNYGYNNSEGPAVPFSEATIQMLDNIDCENGNNKENFSKKFIPIGNQTNSFQGTFDGNNKTITGLYINQTTNGVGLFGYALNAEIKDLKMINCKINSQNEAVGCFVGTTRDVNIFNCGTEESEVNGLNRIGGLIGDYSIMDKNTIISNCYNIGSLTGLGASIGGIVGSVTCYDNTTLTISNCYNTGSVTGSYNSAAGILGEVQCYDDTILTITNCYNTGNIGSYGGGIIGYVYNGQRSLTQIYDCYNFGNVYSGILETIDGYGIIKIYNCYNKGNVIYSGIVGDNDGSQNLGELIVNKCFNIAEIIESGGVGGLSGGIIGNNSGKVTIADCYNTGDITSNNDCIGGVVGNNSGIIVITNCYNTGSVSGSSNIGGILGNTDSTSNTIITNCYNTGSVSGSSNIGGILGNTDSTSNTIITNCYNTGSVSGFNVGGIVGYVQRYGEATITNCYNTGSVSSSDGNAGGIVGCVGSAGFATITNCYNTGSVSSSDGNAGGIVGDIIGGGPIITNCYYLKTSSVKAIGYGTAKEGSYYGTFSSAESGLTKCDDSPSDLAYGTSNLKTVLNAYVSKNPIYTDETSGLEIELTTWEIRASENGGYPVFVITETVA